MKNDRRESIELLYNRLTPQTYGTMEFPPQGDDGEGQGDDDHLASIIYYGATCEPNERTFLFAIKLGRALEKAGYKELHSWKISL